MYDNGIFCEVISKKYGPNIHNKKLITIVTQNTKIKHNANKFNASLSFFGNGTATTYLIEVRGTIMAIAAIKIDNTPKSSGEYILVKIGIEAKPIIFDTLVPTNKIAIFLKTSRDLLSTNFRDFNFKKNTYSLYTLCLQFLFLAF